MAAPRTQGVRRARALARVVGAVTGMVAGTIYGSYVVSQSGGPLIADRAAGLAVVLGSGVAIAAALALAAPLLTVDPFLWMEQMLDHAPTGQVTGAVAGVVLGLLISALVAVLLNPLPWGLGLVISLVLACTLVYVGVRTGTRRHDAFADAFRRRSAAAPSTSVADDPEAQDGTPIVLDTSVLIDGRINDVAATGFIQGRLLIPEFVLEELQRVADSADPMRRSRGRRGLAIVDDLKRQQQVVCEILDINYPGTAEVDVRLIKLARERRAAMMTNDFNLNRLATVEGIRVLNLNELANALKPIVGSGETVSLTITKEGKEPHQGVGYLEDGTMVVVEGGLEHLDRRVQVTVTSVLQTPAGRMIFATTDGAPRRSAEGRPRSAPRPARAGGD